MTAPFLALNHNSFTLFLAECVTGVHRSSIIPSNSQFIILQGVELHEKVLKPESHGLELCPLPMTFYHTEILFRESKPIGICAETPCYPVVMRFWKFWVFSKHSPAQGKTPSAVLPWFCTRLKVTKWAFLLWIFDVTGKVPAGRCSFTGFCLDFFFNKETDKGECDLLWVKQEAEKFWENFYGYMNNFF